MGKSVVNDDKENSSIISKRDELMETLVRNTAEIQRLAEKMKEVQQCHEQNQQEDRMLSREIKHMEEGRSEAELRLKLKDKISTVLDGCVKKIVKLNGRYTGLIFTDDSELKEFVQKKLQKLEESLL